MTRNEIFTKLPETQEQALDLMRALKSEGLTWHLDDRPVYVVDREGNYLFTEQQAEFITSLIARLNSLFTEYPGSENKPINGGAWHAAELVEW